MGRATLSLTFGQFGDKLPPLPGNEITPLTANELSTLSRKQNMSVASFKVCVGKVKDLIFLFPLLWLKYSSYFLLVISTTHTVVFDAGQMVSPWLSENKHTCVTF